MPPSVLTIPGELRAPRHSVPPRACAVAPGHFLSLIKNRPGGRGRGQGLSFVSTPVEFILGQLQFHDRAMESMRFAKDFKSKDQKPVIRLPS